ncbi:RcnB family protein [Sphingomonas sp. HF-S4]|uniref:RcnB family protein n=1 Tax=Sphingomonas agrestis TaxID=3080540 RepID=A0ABU3Y2C4_9SPHN|nr:RcnB family protein [Sphingomonas sp. HF-S4]MDV3455535.1 RcnB family protein [Sphingomonas sp. HF-S4]
MRSTWLMAAAVIAGVAGATPAAAQRVWQDGRWVVMPKTSAPMVARANPHRWTMRDGRWDAGYRAPGGWNGYHRLHRGATLPGYWRGNDFRVHDYLSFGLAAPPAGYSWVRYYDDAVLIDDQGSVWDSIDGISWGGAAAAASASAGFVNADARAGAGYPAPRIQPVDPDDYYDDRDDRDDGRYDGPPPRFDDRYDDRGPYRDDYAPPPPPIAPPPPPIRYGPPPVAFAPPPCPQACPVGYPNGMAWQNGAWVGSYGAAYGGTTTTVVVIPSTTTTTTTTTEYVERRSYGHRPTKRLLRKSCACR